MNQCNICGFIGVFIDHANRKFAKCPKCKSFERQRLIWHFISSNINSFYDKKILHIAPEINIQHKLKSITSNYIGIDLDPNRFGNDIIKMDLTNLLIDNNTIDIILCSHVLEHIRDDDTAIKEIYRVIKPGGFAIICVPIYNHAQTIEHEIPDHLNHVRNYGFSDLFNKLSLYFDTKIINAYDVDIDLQTNCSLNKNQKLFICNKNYDQD